MVCAAWQVPAPSHALPVCLASVHVVAPQGVPCGWFAQAPAPLHAPLVPQLEAGVAPHSLSGSVLFATGPHTPSCPLPFFWLLHAMQAPAQAVSQQNPSTQLDDEHCEALVQAAPLGWSGWQLWSDSRQ